MKSLLGVSLFITATLAATNLETLYQWKYVDFVWPSKEHREEAIKNGEYNFTRVLPMDVDRAKDGRVFISIVREKGVPATLATVSNQMGPGGPLLMPYPSWSWNKNGDCDKISNVYRTVIDKCNRLWVLDNGDTGLEKSCPAQMFVIDLNTDKVIQRIAIPKNIATNPAGQGLLVSPVVETDGPCCERTTVFMSDVAGNSLIVYNGNTFTRLEGPAFQLDEAYVNFTIADETITMRGGIVGMALTPATYENEPRNLVFRAMSSAALYMAPSQVIAKTTDGQNLQVTGSPNILPSQAIALTVSSEGTVFFGLSTEIAIGCWNRYTPMRKQNINIAARDPTRLQFAGGLKIVKEPHRPEEMWMLTNRFQKFDRGTMNYNEVNFRVLRSTVQDLIAGTSCGMPRYLKNAFIMYTERQKSAPTCGYKPNFPW